MKQVARAFRSFFTGIGYLLWDIYMFLEFILVIAPIEFFMRLWYRLNPAVYIRSQRIKAVHEGGRTKADDVFYIFALYTKTALPTFTKNFINAVNRAGHNLVIVSHANLSDSLRKDMLADCHLLIERKGLGRDFGAYKDGVHTLLEKYPDAQRIVFSNDSCFFMEHALDKLIGDLNGPQDFIGVTEVFQFHYHVQSFLISFGRNAIVSPAFAKFWRKYKPITTRRWAIHQGELELTRQMTNAGFRPHILYQAAELANRLRECTVRQAMESVRLMPVAFREPLFETFSDHTDGRAEPSTLQAVSFGIERTVAHIPGLPPRGDPLATINEVSNTLKGWSAGIFMNELIEIIADSNQMHAAGFLFIRHLGMPMFKRDIFYRGIYTLEDVYEFLTNLGEPMRDEIMSDLRRAGSGELNKGLWKIMYRHGSI